jgi:hypothetical protein
MTMTIDNDSPITDLDLRTAAPKTLADAGIHTVGQLLAYNRTDLPHIKGLGKARIDDITNTIAHLGLAFADGVPPIICDTCGNQRARHRRNIVVDLDGHYGSTSLRTTPTCHECDQYHRELWAQTQPVAA